MDDIVIWSFIGMVLMALEIFGIPGVGILFAGFAAITVAVLIYRDPSLNENIGWQLIYFFISTAFWSAVLWIPLNKWIDYSNKKDDYTNMIGSLATTNIEMAKGKKGEIFWSGTTVNAFIHPSCPDDIIAEKTEVKIVDVIDGAFYITTDI